MKSIWKKLTDTCNAGLNYLQDEELSQGSCLVDAITVEDFRLQDSLPDVCVIVVEIQALYHQAMHHLNIL